MSTNSNIAISLMMIALVCASLIMFDRLAENQVAQKDAIDHSIGEVRDDLRVEIISFDPDNLTIRSRITNTGEERINASCVIAGWYWPDHANMFQVVNQIDLAPGQSKIYESKSDVLFDLKYFNKTLQEKILNKTKVGWSKTNLIIAYNGNNNHIIYYDVATKRNRWPTADEYYS